MMPAGGWVLLCALAFQGAQGGISWGAAETWTHSQVETTMRPIGELGSTERHLITKAISLPSSFSLGEEEGARPDQPPPVPTPSAHENSNLPVLSYAIIWYFYFTLGILMMALLPAFFIFCCYKTHRRVRCWVLRCCPCLAEDLDFSRRLSLAECQQSQISTRSAAWSPSARHTQSPARVYFHHHGVSREGTVTLCPSPLGRRLSRTGPSSTGMEGEDLV